MHRYIRGRLSLHEHLVTPCHLFTHVAISNVHVRAGLRTFTRALFRHGMLLVAIWYLKRQLETRIGSNPCACGPSVGWCLDELDRIPSANAYMYNCGGCCQRRERETRFVFATCSHASDCSQTVSFYSPSMSSLLHSTNTHVDRPEALDTCMNEHK